MVSSDNPTKIGEAIAKAHGMLTVSHINCVLRAGVREYQYLFGNTIKLETPIPTKKATDPRESVLSKSAAWSKNKSITLNLKQFDVYQ